MRIYKPTYSKELPEGAKIFTHKTGKDKGKRFAKFKDKRGHTVQHRLTKSGTKILVETTHWHICFEDNLGIRRSLKAFTDRQATQRLADRIQDVLNHNRVRKGAAPLSDELLKALGQMPSKILNKLVAFKVLDLSNAPSDKTLLDYIGEFKDYLTKKERNPKHVREIAGMLTRTFRECNFVTYSDISADILVSWLDGLRDSGKGISKRRYNGLLKTTKHFCKWMVKQRKATSSPIEYLDGLDNPQTDKRHPRRALELNDFLRFLDAAKTGESIYGMSGRERNFLYRFIAETGLRKVDIRERLRVQDCNFKKCKIIIMADRTKNKQEAVIYLKAATSLELKQCCENKLPHALVFRLTDNTSKMVRFDLKNAGIPYVDEHGDYFDFHSLRHQCASLLGMNAETPESVRQKAMRHKTPEMVRHYTHVAESQQREAVEALPDLRQSSKKSLQENVKTGTDDVADTKIGKILPISCFRDK